MMPHQLEAQTPNSKTTDYAIKYSSDMDRASESMPDKPPREIIIFLTDQLGWNLTSRAAAAAMLAQGEASNMRVYCHDFEVELKDPLRLMANDLGWNLTFEPIGDARSDDYNQRSHVTKTALLKIEALDRAAREYDRVLYLDGDILLFKKFPIKTIDFESFAIAAVYDIAECSGLTDPDFQERCKANDLSPHYFNSGVIVVKSSAWLGVDIPAKYWKAHADHLKCCGYKKSCVLVDQCVFNSVFSRAWKRLPLALNFQAAAIFSEAWTYAPVRHYVGKTKFLPVKAWRNDSRDSLLLKDIEAIFGCKLKLNPLSGMARWLNSIRNRKATSHVNECISKVELMYSERL